MEQIINNRDARKLWNIYFQIKNKKKHLLFHVKKKNRMSMTGVKLETIIRDGTLLVFATTRLNLTCVFPGCNNTNVYNNDKSMLKHARKMHPETSITLVLPSNQ